jgi:hypothetical protein
MPFTRRDFLQRIAAMAATLAVAPDIARAEPEPAVLPEPVAPQPFAPLELPEGAAWDRVALTSAASSDYCSPRAWRYGGSGYSTALQPSEWLVGEEVEGRTRRRFRLS